LSCFLSHFSSNNYEHGINWVPGIDILVRGDWVRGETCTQEWIFFRESMSNVPLLLSEKNVLCVHVRSKWSHSTLFRSRDIYIFLFIFILVQWMFCNVYDCIWKCEYCFTAAAAVESVTKRFSLEVFEYNIFWLTSYMFDNQYRKLDNLYFCLRLSFSSFENVF
jgi:hypothetical protein